MSGPFTVMEQATLAVPANESVTRIVKVEVPAGPVGVPETTPVAAASVNPAGKVPAVISKTSGGVSPVAGKACE